MNNEMRPHTPGGSRPSQATQTLGRSVGGAVDSAMDAMDGAVDRGKAMVSDAGAAASDMAESATQQIKTFASELDFGQFWRGSSSSWDAEHRIILDDLVSALKHELHAAEISEGAPPAPDV